jgi:hypothetical protein
MDENEPTPAAPEEGKHAAKARRSRKSAKTQVASDDAGKPSETPPAEPVAAEDVQKKEWVSDPRKVMHAGREFCMVGRL